MGFGRRRLWIILLAVPLLLAAADTLYWYVAEQRLADGFGAWVAERQATGWKVTAGKPIRGGWPLAATLTVPTFTLSGGAADIPDGLQWTAERLVLLVALARPGTLELSAKGTQQLRVSRAPPVPYIASRLEVALPLQAEPVPSFIDLKLADLHAGDVVSIASLALRLDFNPAAQSGQPAVTYALHAAGVIPPPGAARALGPRIDSVNTDGVLNGPLVPAQTLTSEATSWRDAGGSLVVQHAAVVWGPLDLTASATLALDDSLQPMGAGSAKATGYAEALDALASRAAISRSAATAAKAVLSLLANAPDDGSQPSVEVPLTLQYRTLTMHQVPLVRLPEVDWP